jgi:hypothetical protein
MPKLNDLTGKRFGRLLVRKRVGTNHHRKPIWECQCDCGNTKEVISSYLLKGMTKSCGCLRIELIGNRKTHGMRNTRFYKLWIAMRRRCEYENNPSYKYYGGRGIQYCDRWQEFSNFKADMYDAYLAHVEEYGETQTTLDRIDVNKDYTPENTRWATWTTQNRNTRTRGDNKTGHRGVFQRDSGDYYAYIKANKELIYLGIYHNVEDAVLAREEAERLYWKSTTE